MNPSMASCRLQGESDLISTLARHSSGLPQKPERAKSQVLVADANPWSVLSFGVTIPILSRSFNMLVPRQVFDLHQVATLKPPTTLLAGGKVLPRSQWQADGLRNRW